MAGTNLPDLPLGLKPINLGVVPNDGQGDNLRSAFDKVNDNLVILSGSLSENLTESREVYVDSIIGNDDGFGTQELPFKTIQAATTFAYQKILPREYRIYINISPGVYIEDVTVIDRPVGAQSEDYDVVFRKDPSKNGIVEWGFDSSISNQAVLLYGAKVLFEDITFTTATITDFTNPRSYITADKESTVFISNLEFDKLGHSTTENSYHIRVLSSTLDIIGTYQITGATYTHIYASSSTVRSTAGSQVRAEAPNSITVSKLIEGYANSKIILPSSSFSFNGIYSGRVFLIDFGTRIKLDSYPNSMSLGQYQTIDSQHPINLLGPIEIRAGSITSGPSTFSSSSLFSGVATFTNSINITGVGDVSGILRVPTLPTSDNTTNAASTAFVQSVIQQKIVESLPVATTSLYGIVKIDKVDADPVVYVRSSVDSRLNLKANVNSPTFTGDPKAPTPNPNDNTTSLATTAFVSAALASFVTLPAGTVLPYAGTSVPTGFLDCDGSTLLRADYPALFTAIQTTFGSTNSTNFKIPDTRDRTLIGANAGQRELGTTGGSFSITLTTNQMPRHTHNIVDPGHAHAVNDPGHAHGVNDPGHTHSLTSTPRQTNAGSSSTSTGAEYRSNGPGAEMRTTPAGTGISIFGAFSNISLQNSATGITASQTGGTDAINITPKHITMNFIIKT